MTILMKDELSKRIKAVAMETNMYFTEKYNG